MAHGRSGDNWGLTEENNPHRVKRKKRKKSAKRSPLPTKKQLRGLRKAGLTTVRKTDGLADLKRAKAAFDEQRARKEAVGMECCLIVVGYVSGREPFRLLGRVSADTGLDAMPDPELTMGDMQPVAFAAKMAFAKILNDRKHVKVKLSGKR